MSVANLFDLCDDVGLSGIIAHLTGADNRLFSRGWLVIETRIWRSSSRQGLWLVAVFVDGSKHYGGEEWSREAAIQKVAAILEHIQSGKPDATDPASNI